MTLSRALSIGLLSGGALLVGGEKATAQGRPLSAAEAFSALNGSVSMPITGAPAPGTPALLTPGTVVSEPGSDAFLVTYGTGAQVAEEVQLIRKSVMLGVYSAYTAYVQDYKKKVDQWSSQLPGSAHPGSFLTIEQWIDETMTKTMAKATRAIRDTPFHAPSHFAPFDLHLSFIPNPPKPVGKDQIEQQNTYYAEPGIAFPAKKLRITK